VTSHPGVAGGNGKFYVLGGFTGVPHTGAMDIAFEYDVATDKWRALPPLRSPRAAVGTAFVNGKIHVIGGRTAGYTDLVELHDVYDPKTGSWKSAAPLPTVRSGGAIVYYHGLILYAGGGGEGYTENEGYDPKTDKWMTLAPIPEMRNGFGAGAVGAHAYFAGGAIGCGGAPTSDTLFEFTISER
jgi:hypothetical protein